MPSRSKMRAINADASGSSAARSRGAVSTIVTWTPNRANT
jgi:hypothetical protein